jgi:hypothetical protein
MVYRHRLYRFTGLPVYRFTGLPVYRLLSHLPLTGLMVLRITYWFTGLSVYHDRFTDDRFTGHRFYRLLLYRFTSFHRRIIHLSV